MKAHRRFRRALRSLALTGGLAAMLAIPAVAGAMPIDNYRPHDAAASGKSAEYTLPSGFQSDVQSSNDASRPYTLPAAFQTDAQTKPPAVTTAPASEPPVVVREIPGGSDQTLAIVLASVALGITLCGTAYVALRVTRIQRGAAGLNS